VRSYTIRKKYQPARPSVEDGPRQPPCDPIAGACEILAEAVLNKKTNYKEIKRRLFTLTRAGARTKQQAAKLLGCDARTLEAGMRATDCRAVDG
jgi:hypothetical protein